MNNTLMARMNPLCVALLSIVVVPAVSAQTYTRTDTTVYHDDTTNWVLGQVERVESGGVVDGRTYANRVVDSTTYNTRHQPWKIYKFGKLQQTITYNADGTVATVADGAGHVTTLSSWKRGVPQAIGFADGTAMSAVVGDDGTIASVVNEAGAKTCYLYDAMGRVRQVQYPQEAVPADCDTTGASWYVNSQSFAPVATAEYGLPAGHWKQTVSTRDARKITYFDAMWRPVVEEAYDNTDPAATRSITVKRYDADGHLVFQSYPVAALASYTDALAGVSTTYDELDRVKTVVQDSELGPLTTTTSYGANAQGPYTIVRNPRGYSTTTTYLAFDTPSLDNPIAINETNARYTDIQRDLWGKPEAITRRNADGSVSETRSYTYNDFQELCRTDEPETKSTFFGYDTAGNLSWSAAGFASTTGGCRIASQVASRRADRTYDPRNRVTSLAFPDGLGNTTYTYTSDGLPETQTVDNGGNTVATTYTYNARRLLKGEAMDWNTIHWFVGYDYDKYGTRSSQRYPDGAIVAFAPNALGQPRQAGAYATGVSYYPNGAIRQFTYGNGIVHTMAQNARQLPQVSKDAGVGAADALWDTYSYDANGNVASIGDSLPGNRGDRVMSYDGLDRLKTVDSTMFAMTGPATYTYDALDNLTKVVAPGRTHYYCYDARWQLANIKTGTCATGATVIGLGYDDQGNLANRNGTAYTFDFGNRLRSVSGSPASTYVYDAKGLRVRDATNASKYSLYTGTGQLAYTSDGRIGVASRYVYLGGSLVAIVEKTTATGTSATKYQHTDALGSPVAVTNESATVVETNEWEPYGKELTATHDGPGYTGHVYDQATGLNYMQQRYYDPQIGRFLSVDPVTASSSTGGNFNRYWYANNNPYRFKDPDGRLACGGNDGCREQLRELEKRGIPTWQAGASNTQGKSSGESKTSTLATVTVVGQRLAPAASGGARLAPWVVGLGRTLGGMLEFARGPFLFFYAPHPCGGEPCGELRGIYQQSQSGKGQRGMPDTGPANEWLDHPTGKQSRLYNPDGTPAADVDRGHDHGQGNPHAHNWVDGVRQPGVPVSDVPEQSGSGG